MAMKSLWIGNILNIILDPLFIFGFAFIPEMGIKGAAIATVIGRTVAVIYQLYKLNDPQFYIRFSFKDIIPDFKIIKSLYDIAWPATFQFIIASASWIFLASMVAEYGSSASAAYQTAIRLLIFFILPAWGMSNAVATLVGQNLGAKNPQRAESAVNITAYYNFLFMASVTLVFLFLSPQILQFFIADHEKQQMYFAVLALKIISSGYIFYGIGMVLTQAFNGAGDTKTPTWIYFFGFWTFQIPFAYILHKYTKLELVGIFWAIPIAETVMTFAFYFLFRKGNWKKIVL
jgi:putative MATE family efflux protein